MSNQLLTLTLITREALRILHNNLVFAKGVNRQYSQEFAQTGAKVGSSINIRKPNKYPIRTGPTLNIAGTTENYVPLTLTTQAGVDTSFSSVDLTLSLDDFGKRVLSPAMARVSSKIDFDGLQAAGYATFNCVGTPGSPPGSNTGSNLAVCNAPQVFLNAGMLMDNMATPRDENRRVVLNPIGQATSVANLSGLYNDTGSIGAQYRKGVMGQALGFEFAMDQNVNILTCGSRVATTGNANGANQTGTSYSLTALTANSTVYTGEKFTIANVYSVNPENGQSTGQLAMFAVLAPSNGAAYYTADANGNATLNISPGIYTANSNGNANATVTALPANGANCTWYGAANATPTMNLAYHQDAYTLATADLIMPGGVDFAARETYDGISMRIIRAYDITNDLFPTRIDTLYGYAAPRPEFGCVIWG
jgi:hypothetical protein